MGGSRTGRGEEPTSEESIEEGKCLTKQSYDGATMICNKAYIMYTSGPANNYAEGAFPILLPVSNWSRYIDMMCCECSRSQALPSVLLVALQESVLKPGQRPGNETMLGVQFSLWTVR